MVAALHLSRAHRATWRPGTGLPPDRSRRQPTQDCSVATYAPRSDMMPRQVGRGGAARRPRSSRRSTPPPGAFPDCRAPARGRRPAPALSRRDGHGPLLGLSTDDRALQDRHHRPPCSCSRTHAEQPGAAWPPAGRCQCRCRVGRGIIVLSRCLIVNLGADGMDTQEPAPLLDRAGAKPPAKVTADGQPSPPIVARRNRAPHARRTFQNSAGPPLMMSVIPRR